MNFHAFLTVRRIRLLSGLVMFAYLTAHLLNHALGIFSLTLAESGLKLAIMFWRNPVATFFLYGAAAVHVGLALWTLYSRREWQGRPSHRRRLREFPSRLPGKMVPIL
jgi:adenylate cyclase